MGEGTATLSALQSISPHGEDLTYMWTLIEKPTGSQATLSQPTSVISTFLADVVGSYTVSLLVSGDHLSSHLVQKVIVVAGTKEQKVIAGSVLYLMEVFCRFGYNLEIVFQPEGSRARALKSTTQMARFHVDIAGSYIVRWKFQGGDEEYSDYSLIHAYWPSGTVVFGPQEWSSSRSLCSDRWMLAFLGCENQTWRFNVTDLEKNYALSIEYSSAPVGFISLNGRGLAGRYDFTSERNRFARQVDILASNELKASFPTGADVTISVQEMSFSGTESDPPSASVNSLEVVQGMSASRMITVTDAGSTQHNYALLEQPSHGSAEIDANGEIRYTANSSYEGPDFVIIKIENDNGLAQIVKLLITVIAQSNTRDN